MHSRWCRGVLCCRGGGSTPAALRPGSTLQPIMTSVGRRVAPACAETALVGLTSCTSCPRRSIRATASSVEQSDIRSSSLATCRQRVNTRLVTFGAEPRREQIGQLEVIVLEGYHVRGQRTNPIAAALAKRAARRSGRRTVTSSTSWRAALPRSWRGSTRRRVFVTDLGGGGLDVSSFVSTDGWYHGHLHISEYSRRVAGHAGSSSARVDIRRRRYGQDSVRVVPLGTPCSSSAAFCRTRGFTT